MFKKKPTEKEVQEFCEEMHKVFDGYTTKDGWNGLEFFLRALAYGRWEVDHLFAHVGLPYSLTKNRSIRQLTINVLRSLDRKLLSYERKKRNCKFEKTWHLGLQDGLCGSTNRLNKPDNQDVRLYELGFKKGFRIYLKGLKK